MNTDYDLAIIDLIYAHLNEEFEILRKKGAVSIGNPQLLVTGLLAIKELSTPPRDTKIVIWTSGDANRRLHMLYAYEELGMRVFCSKSSGNGTTDTLVSALKAAAAGQVFIDPVLNPYLPATNSPKLSETILRASVNRTIWRALALGARTRSEVSEITRYGKKTIGNRIPEMLDELVQFDAGVPRGSAPMAQLISYASSNWEFFLDETIRARWP
jgi:DNA-binding NarL/FixJ family response regulator